MRALVFIGESPFGEAMEHLVKSKTGLSEDIYSFDLLLGQQNDSGSSLLRMEAAMDRILAGRKYDEIVFLADSVTSNATTIASSWALKTGIPSLIIAGTNVPMAVDAVYLKEQVDSREELFRTLAAEGKAGITRLL